MWLCLLCRLVLLSTSIENTLGESCYVDLNATDLTCVSVVSCSLKMLSSPYDINLVVRDVALVLLITEMRPQVDMNTGLGPASDGLDSNFGFNTHLKGSKLGSKLSDLKWGLHDHPSEQLTNCNGSDTFAALA